MEQRKYNPYIMGKMVFDLNEKRIPAIEEEVGQHGIDISVLGSQNASQERDITEIKAELISVAGSLNSMGTRVTALETPKAISTTPFETGETYKGKPVKKVAIPLNNAEVLTLTNMNTDLGIGLGDLPVGIVLRSFIISDSQLTGSILTDFRNAFSLGGNIKASTYPNLTVNPNADLVIEYIERDPAVEVSES